MSCSKYLRLKSLTSSNSQDSLEMKSSVNIKLGGCVLAIRVINVFVKCLVAKIIERVAVCWAFALSTPFRVINVCVKCLVVKSLNRWPWAIGCGRVAGFGHSRFQCVC